MIKKTILALSVLLCGCGSEEGAEKIDSHTIVIDVPASEKENILKVSDLADSSHFIRLETKQDCFIGQISKLIPMKDRLIVVDGEQSKSIFFFDKSGKFINKISRQGRSGSEYIEMTDVSVDVERENFCVRRNDE